MDSQKQCPFCGKTKIKVESKESNNRRIIKGIRYSGITASVRCNTCHARGPTVGGLYKTGNSLQRQKVIEECQKEALKAWVLRI